MAEYRSNFDWETDYSLRVCWEISSSYAEQYVECSSLEDMKAYKNEEKELETPDYEEVEADISGDNELTGYNTKYCEVNVGNLRPKQKEQITVQVVFQHNAQSVVDWEGWIKNQLKDSVLIQPESMEVNVLAPSA